MTRKWNSRELQMEYARADDDRVSAALWEENNTSEQTRTAIVAERVEYAEQLREHTR